MRSLLDFEAFREFFRSASLDKLTKLVNVPKEAVSTLGTHLLLMGSRYHFAPKQRLRHEESAVIGGSARFYADNAYLRRKVSFGSSACGQLVFMDILQIPTSCRENTSACRGHCFCERRTSIAVHRHED